MAPSPENDNTPKAPDKSEKSKSESQVSASSRSKESSAVDGDSKDASVSGLDDGELKALLDEAITYKSPKDREGKSLLFNHLLTAAEDDLRNARATSASGPQYVRYFNTTATRRSRNRKQPSSISENLTHGGSLNNLAKEELYDAAIHLQRSKKTVSTRQREGGSLPCNVNVGCSFDRQFFEEVKRPEKQKPEYLTINMESESLLEHDVLDQTAMELEKETSHLIPRLPAKYTTSAKIEISGVDDHITVPTLDRYKTSDEPFTRHNYDGGHHKYGVLSTNNGHMSLLGREFKKVDENYNSVSQNSFDSKKRQKRKPLDKNVVVLESSQVTGHRGDIIDDLDKLVNYIDGNEDQQSTSKAKSSVQKSHKLQKHLFDDAKGSKKQRTRSKAKGANLQKSNSLEEMSTTKLEDFSFSQDEGKVTLRPTKSNAERPRERRSWGTTEQIQIHNLYGNASAENLETADFRVVTKKKKSKKRRSSLSGRRQTYSMESHVSDFNRVPSPEPRRKSAISVPHSEKSNDSSDVDSVHSLPIDSDRLKMDRDNADGLNFPISYADIAKNSGNAVEKPKCAASSEEKKRSHDRNGEKAKTPDKNGGAISTESDCGKQEATPERPPKAKITSEVQDKPKKPVISPAPVLNVSQSVQTSPPKVAQQNALAQSPPSDKVQNSVEKIQANPILNVKNPPPEINYVNYIQNFPSIPAKEKSPNALVPIRWQKNVPECNLAQNWPPVVNNNAGEKFFVKTYPCANQKTVKASANSIVNSPIVANRQDKVPTPNNINVRVQKNMNISEPQVIMNSDQPVAIYTYQNVPLHIPDVRTIEMLQFEQMLANYVPEAPLIIGRTARRMTNKAEYPQSDVPDWTLPRPARSEEQPVVTNSTKYCEFKSARDSSDCERTTGRPPVVILSGSGDKEVSGITFGFEVNEQLLSDDVSDSIAARFVPPKCSATFNYDEIVSFISTSWDEIVNGKLGKVTWYTEDLHL